jgi:phosphoglycerate kinase
MTVNILISKKILNRKDTNMASYNKMSVEDIKPAGKKVFVRVDFNVPQDESLKITDDTRIRESLKTIQYLSGKGARVILCSHLGRPKGKKNEKYSLKPVAVRLSELLKKPVAMMPDCVGDAVKAEIAKMKDGDVALLENVRFYDQEEKNDPAFAKQLSELAEMYVNDAFGTAHRAHASTEGVTKYLKPCAAGFLMMKEIKYLGGAVSNPARPFVAIIGGAKISGKIDVIQNLMNTADTVIVGGGMAYTFFKSQGLEVGKSLLEPDKVDLAKATLEKSKSIGKPLLLPVDNVIAQDLKEGVPTKVVPSNQIPADWEGLDVGPETLKKYEEVISKAKTIFWNGPVGAFEVKPFDVGTLAIAKMLAAATGRGAATIVGGGDSVAAVTQMGLESKMSHVSTGGGASLEFMEGKQLPGIVALTDKN